MKYEISETVYKQIHAHVALYERLLSSVPPVSYLNQILSSWSFTCETA